MEFEVTEEEYNKALANKDLLVKELFDLRMKIAINGDNSEKNNQILEEVKIKKREISKNQLIIERYKIIKQMKERGRNL